VIERSTAFPETIMRAADVGARAQECYGEDPVLTGQMGAGLTRELRRNVIACVKYFALNSIENSRFNVDVVVDKHPLHEVYLPHFDTTSSRGSSPQSRPNQ
jgi:beta-glucosidase